MGATVMRWLRVLLDGVFPPACEVCGEPLDSGAPIGLCRACLASMLPPPPPLCPRCGLPLPAGAPCPDCRRRPPAFASAHAVGLYLPTEGGLNPLAVAVHALKYRRRRVLARALGELLAARYPFDAERVVVPVPLHRTRLRSRGYNQALLLARVLARRRGLSLVPRALVRTRATAGQPGLGADARRRNLDGAFAVRSAAAVVGRSVVLVDDVLTTGATADACAAALLAAGAERVDAFTVGRAP
jgi:ComF family protein